MTNFQQLGPGQELEDAMILGTVLGAAIDRTGLAAALEAYDEVRRPRSQKVADHGKRLGMLWTGMVDGVGMDPQKLREAFLEWHEESEAFDLVEHQRQALTLMAEKLQQKDADTKAHRKSQGFVGDGTREALNVLGKAIWVDRETAQREIGRAWGWL